MDEKIKEQDVLLVKEKEDTKLKAVSGIDKDGTLKTVPPIKKHEADFMKIDKHSNVLENFMSNFLRQAKNPTHFSFFKVPAQNVDAEAHVLGEMLREPASNKAAIDSVSVNAIDYAGRQAYKPLDENRIDWEQFEKIGVSHESLEKTGSLEAMLNYRKSNGLLPITAQLGDTTIRTEARLSLREASDGRIVPVVHNIRAQPELDKPFYGISFSAEDKANLLASGNLGRTVELTNRSTGEVTPSFVSIDRLTNELVAYRADRARIPNEVKGVQLDETQKTFLKQGAAIYVEGMTAKSGKSFNASLQYNADKRGLEFQFPDNKNQQSQNQSEQRELRIPQILKGRPISPEESEQLKTGQTVYMTGLKDDKGEEFKAYVRPNFEKGKFDFLKWNPDQSKAKEVTPDNASKTQVAVNSEGKTNEATKSVNEPLKQGQTEPNEQQRKPKGVKM